MNYTLVTGATGGLGSEFCFQLAKMGDNLIITGRSMEKLNILMEKLKPFGVQIWPIDCDLTSFSDRQKMFDLLREKSVKISKLINVAGVDTQKAFEKYTQEKILFQTRVNFEATVSITKFALEERAENLEILTVSSMCGLCSFPYFSLYSATKSALINFFDGIRYEYKKLGIKVTTVMPGSVPTRDDIIKDIEKQGLQGKLSKMDKEKVVKKSLIALSKNKRRYIPGFYNKLVNFVNKITPYSLRMRILAKKFSKKEKDAF